MEYTFALTNGDDQVLQRALVGKQYFVTYVKTTFKMADFNKGFLGSFIGKMGTGVGSSWRGKHYLKSLPAKTKHKRKPSPKQEAARARFSMARRFVQPIAQLLELTFTDNSSVATGANNAVAQVITEAITGVYPALSIDYSLVKISRGSFPPADNAVATTTGGKLYFTWTPNADTGSARPTDKAVLVAYSPEKQRWVYVTSGFERSAGAGNLDISAFSGDVHTWIAFVNQEETRASNSVYCGKVTL